MITAHKRKELADKLSKISCSAKEKTIFRSKYGLDDGIYKSNGETAEIFNINRETVRVIIQKLEKLMK